VKPAISRTGGRDLQFRSADDARRTSARDRTRSRGDGGAGSVRLGLFVNEPDELREYRKDFLFIRSQRRTSEAIAHHVRRVAIGVVVTGLLYVLWQGVMLAIGRVPQ
jgi:hypothetical protein